MHGRAYRGRTATVRCGPLKVLWEREVGWPWLRAPASLSAAEGDPPRHTGVCSGPLTPRRDHHGPSPYGDAARGSAGAGEGHGTRPRAWTTRPRLVWFSKVVKVKCAAFSFPAYGILSLEEWCCHGHLSPTVTQPCKQRSSASTGSETRNLCGEYSRERVCLRANSHPPA